MERKEKDHGTSLFGVFGLAHQGWALFVIVLHCIALVGYVGLGGNLEPLRWIMIPWM